MRILLFIYSIKDVLLNYIIIFQFYSLNFQDFLPENINLNKETELNKELEKHKIENDKLKKEINSL